MSPERLFAVKEEDGKGRGPPAPALFRPLLLHERRSRRLGGSIYPRESGRFEITHVPAAFRERDRQITGRNRRDLAPVLKRYERVCFTKEAVRPLDRPGTPFASMIHPGHPLMLAVSDMMLEQHGNLAAPGSRSSLIPSMTATSPRFSSCSPTRSNPATACPFQAAPIRPRHSRWQRHPLLAGHRTSTTNHCQPADVPCWPTCFCRAWIRADQEQRLLALAATTLVPEHYDEVAGRRIAHVDKTLAAVHERLTKEIAFWSDRWIKLKEDQAAGKDVRLNLDNIRRTINDLEGRLENRKKELQSMRHVVMTRRSFSAARWSFPPDCCVNCEAKRRRTTAACFRPTPLLASALNALPWTPFARRGSEGLPSGGCLRPEMRMGHHILPSCCGWQTTGSAPHRSQRQRQRRNHGHGDHERNSLRAEPGVRSITLAIVLVGEDDAVGRAALRSQSVQGRTRLGRRPASTYDLKRVATCTRNLTA